jgi:hypothetical protein
MRSTRVRVAAVVAALSLAATVPAVTLGTTERAEHNHAVAATTAGHGAAVMGSTRGSTTAIALRATGATSAATAATVTSPMN